MIKDDPEDKAHRTAYLQYYEREHRDEYDDESYRWHPRHRVWTAVRHERERYLLRIFRSFSQALAVVDVLEIGCGNGVNLRFFAEMGFDPSRLCGVDISSHRLRRARALNPAMSLVQGDGSRLPFPSRSFDLATQFVAFSSMGRREREVASREVIRVLRPGGHVLWYDTRVPRVDQVPDGVTVEELGHLFPELEWQRPQYLHSPLIGRLGSHELLAELATRVPLLRRTNLLLIGTLPG